jgi:hypothetical protein
MPEQPKWPHLENLDRVLKDYPDYLSVPGYYTVTEKVHGFNARFGVDLDHTPWVGTRNLTVAEDDEVQGFRAFAQPLLERLGPGETVFGEWYGRGVQKGIDYGEKQFAMFGYHARNRDGSEWWGDWQLVETVAYSLGIKTVPVLMRATDGVPLDRLMDLRSAESRLAPGSIHEGIVISHDPPILDHYGRVLIAKFKSPGFEERSHARREKPAPADLTVLNAFVDEYVNEGRLEHVLQQVSEFVGDPLDPRVTGEVLRAMHADVVRESGPDYEALSDNDKKMLGKVMNPRVKELLQAARDAEMAA